MNSGTLAAVSILAGGLVLGGVAAIVYHAAVTMEPQPRPHDEYIRRPGKAERSHRKQVRRQIAARMQRSYP